MKFRKILLSFLAIILLASCNKETEVYEKKDVKVDSVFDNIEKKEEDKPEEKKEEKAEDKKEEENQDNKEDQTEDNQNPETADTPDNTNDNNQANPPADNYGRKQTTATVNMRSTPNADIDNLVESVPGDAYVTVVEEQNINGINWSKVTYQGQTGYIRSDLLR